MQSVNSNDRPDVVLGLQPLADLLLVAGGHVAHREDLVARAQVLLRRAVAVEAPGHLEGRVLRDERHLVDAAVAGLAADALGDVDRVVEVDVVRQVVDLDPLDRLVRSASSRARARAPGDWFQIWEWQFMQVFVGGMLAKAACSTVVWQ